MSEETALTTTEKDENGLVLAADFGDAPEGFEGQTAKDFSIPFLVLLQDNSPQTKKKSDRYVEGAEAGMFYNTVTKQLYDGDNGVPFQICFVDHCVQEWWPRDSTEGKGFVARHEVGSDYVEEAVRLNNGNRFGKVPTERGTQLVEAYKCWGIIPGEEGDIPDFAIFSFESKKIKPYKDWNTVISKFTVFNPRTKKKQVPDRYAHLIRLTSVFTTDPKGDYFNVKLDPSTVKKAEDGKDLSLLASLQTPGTFNFDSAKEFHGMVVSGQAKEAEQDAEDVQTDPGF